MYNYYTPLQQRQLALQEYSNTQSTYLLVCAPARSTALKATLTDQLHRKFRLVTELAGGPAGRGTDRKRGRRASGR